MHENELSTIIVESAIEVHRTLGGPGLLESVYEEALVYELHLRSVEVQRQHVVPIRYKGRQLHSPLRLDLLVAGLVIVECKAQPVLPEVTMSQMLTYLRCMELRLGLVINFGGRLVRDGLHRVVNGL